MEIFWVNWVTMSRAESGWVTLSLAETSWVQQSLSSWVKLSRAEFSWVELSWAELSWVEPSWVKLSQAELSWVMLSRAESSTYLINYWVVWQGGEKTRAKASKMMVFYLHLSSLTLIEMPLWLFWLWQFRGCCHAALPRCWARESIFIFRVCLFKPFLNERF